jgi:hypothetical protein
MRSSAATDEYARAETDPLCHFRNHRSAAPTIKLRGPHSRFQPDHAGGRVHREKVSSGTAEARTRPSSTPRLAPGRPTRCDTSYRGQRTYSSADERAFDPCMSLRCLHGHPCMTGGRAHSAEADDFPPAMAVALVTWVSQMATNTIGSSIPFPPRLGAPCCLCWCSAPTTLLPPRCSGPSPVHGADRRDVGYGRIS